MTIEVYAMLKDYFEKQFIIKEQITDINSLKEYLSEQKPEATGILRSCRFAVDDEFVSDTYQLKENDSISIIPPSSGG
ncbi:MoaD/ThiS family protein [Desertivirga brevis]|uniref:MoaD/ThiS family protein n=1 Tax=Desertivirga brevis TaxID=2810310 RepID=UPI001A964CF3|nr:MoaD/ThiS family protein [Pedobacter sp. SYSU D00873]